MNGLIGDAKLEAALLRASGGGIGKIGSEGEVFETIVLIFLEVLKITGEVDDGFEMAVAVEFTLHGRGFFDLPFLGGVIPTAAFLADNSDSAVLDRLAEEILGVDIEEGFAAGEIVGAIGINVDGEGGKFVATDAEFAAALRPIVVLLGIEFRGNGAIAELDFAGNFPVGRSDAKAGGGQFFVELFVAGFVFDGQIEFFGGHSVTV